jgi:hypothetical protein
LPPLLPVEALAWIARPEVETALATDLTVITPPCPFCRAMFACTAQAGVTWLLSVGSAGVPLW